MTLLPYMLDTAANRVAMPDADRTSWVPCDKLAQLIYLWAKEDRPSNGSFIKLVYNNGNLSTLEV